MSLSTTIPQRVPAGQEPLPRLVRPESLRDALDAARAGCTPYRGGTVLFGEFEGWQPQPSALVDLKRVAELHGVRWQQDELVLGAATPLQALLADPLVTHCLPILQQVTGMIGNIRVRTAGSIGGNLCAGERSSDLLTLLVALEARVVVARSGGSRTVTISDFHLGHRQVDLRPDELLTEIKVPAPDEVRAAYRKVQFTGRPSLSVAAVVRAGQPDVQHVVIGAAGDRPQFITWPVGHQPAAEAIRELAYASDHAFGVEYKRAAAVVLVERVLQDLAAVLPASEPPPC